MEIFYNPRTLENITTALIDMFNQFYVVKYDNNNVAIQNIPVPCQYGNIEKAQADRLENHSFDTSGNQIGNRFYLTIPRMSIKFDGVTYDGSRATGVNNWRYFKAEDGQDIDLLEDGVDTLFRDYQPTPWNFNFTLYIKTDSFRYYSQLIQWILPYFNPSLYLRVKEFYFLNVERDLKVTIMSNNTEFSEDLTNPDTKYSNGSMNITVEGYMYRPWDYGKMIKFINSKYFVNEILIDNYITSGAIYTSAGVNTSAVPSEGSYITSAYYIDDHKEYDWFKGTSAIG